jgi:gamma-glutamyl:cysteine ligase YbdK (ATP-grasp superfamily)
MKAFRQLFNFDQSKVMFVGVEREFFTTDNQGNIVPKAKLVLENANGSFGYELSACQVESRIGPCRLECLMANLIKADESLTEYFRLAGVNCGTYEVAPVDMPLDVYLDPSGRYQEIVKRMPREILLAACRVIGTHIHIGMPDHETALRVYNRVIEKCNMLCALGDGSLGERLDIYRTVAPDCRPGLYESWKEFHDYARAKGFDQDLRKCWTLIRISKHGTIEFRMFGATSSLEKIVSWAKLCHDLCQKAMV